MYGHVGGPVAWSDDADDEEGCAWCGYDLDVVY